MTRAAEPVTPSSVSAPSNAGALPTVEQSLNWLKGKLTCPFCGTVTDRADEACARCGMHDTAGNRDATKARIGPWYVLQSRNPAAPGMTYATLMLLVKKNLVTARSIVRGPTTHQLWAFAANVRGLSREFGVCWSCGQGVEKAALQCTSCDQSQKPPASAEDLVERPGPAPSEEPASADDVLANETPARAAHGAMDIVLPTPSDDRATPSRASSDPSMSVVETPPSEPRAKSNNGRILSDEQLASAKRSSRYASESPWKRLRQGLTVLLLTVAVVLGIAMVILPDFRRTSLYWAGEKFAPVMDKWRAWGERSLPTKDTEPAPINLNGPPVERKNRSKPVIVPTEPQKDQRQNVQTERPLPEPKASSSIVDDMVTQNLVRTLDAQAREAEIKGDWGQALSVYQQLTQIPERFRPDDLAGRLANARVKASNQ